MNQQPPAPAPQNPPQTQAPREEASAPDVHGQIEVPTLDALDEECNLKLELLIAKLRRHFELGTYLIRNSAVTVDLALKPPPTYADLQVQDGQLIVPMVYETLILSLEKDIDEFYQVCNQRREAYARAQGGAGGSGGGV